MKKLLQLTKILVLVSFNLLFNAINLTGQEPGNALDFDGSNDFIQIGTYWQGGQDCGYSGCKDGDLFLYLNNYTIEVWIKPSDVDGVTNQYEAIIANGNSGSQLAYSIFINRSGFASYRWFDQTTGTTKEIKTAAGSITNNRWQHIALYKSGTTLKIYINGVQQTTTGDAFNEGYQSSGKVVFVGNAPYMSYPFKGQIDELHLWKSEAVLPNLYNVVGGGGNLWCNLRFNYSAGNLVSSISATANYYPSNGIMYNMDNSDWVESYAMVVPKITAPANNANGSFTANWTAPVVGTVEKYYMEIATDPEMINKVPAYSPYVDVGNVLSYTFTGLTQGQTYYYRLRAYKSSVGDVGAYTPVSSITLNIQEPGNALDFDGINDYVQIGTSWQGQRVYNASTSTWFYGDLYFYNTPFTVEAWIKPVDVDGVTNQYEAVIANSNANSHLQYSVFINRAGFVSYRWYDPGTGTTKEIRTAPGSIINNRWQHVAISKSGSTLLIYINGLQVATSGPPATEGTVEGGTVLVGGAAYMSVPFKGLIDELHVWKYQARPPSLYNVVGGEGNLYCNFRFNVLEGNNITSVSSITGTYPSNGVMYNMDGNADRIESFAMIVPKIITPTNIGCGKFTANWTAPVVGSVEKYYLEIATDPGMINKVPAYSPYVDVGNVLTYTLTGLNYQTYFYRLRAFKSSVGDVGTYTPVSSVNIIDVTAPVVVTQNITVSLDETGNVTITPEQVDNGSTDNCTIQSLALDKTSFNCSNIGDNTVVLTVTDAKGNSSTGTATVTIPDNMIPAIGTITQPTLSVPSGSVVLSNLPPSGTWTIAQLPGGKTTEGSGSSTTLAGLATGTYTFTVTNEAGCTSGSSANVVIDPQPVQVTADPDQSKVYGSDDPALTYTFTPELLEGDSFTGNLSRVSGELPGTYAIEQGTLSAGPKYSIIFISDDFTITPKPLTVTGVTADNKVYDGTDVATLSGGSLTGVITGDEVILNAGTGVFADQNAGVGKAVICSGYTLSGSDAVNYTLSQPEGITADILKADPVVTWTAPEAINYGTALNATQLNATSSVPGTFTYTPASGTVLNAGSGQTLSADFAPADNINYNPVNNTQVQITVNKATPVVSWSNPAAITYGTALSATQLNATSSVPGTFTYTPAGGEVLNAGANQILSVDFTPADVTNYNPVSNTQVQITVNKATPVVSWSNPAAITYGTALSATQLNATASVPGTFNYTPAAGTVLNAGLNQTLSVNFNPSDVLNYNPVNNTQVEITVNKATPFVAWSHPAAITYGTALSATQLNAIANVAGTLTYTPASGTILNAGINHFLSVSFTPDDNVNYNSISNQQVQITVNKADQTITFNSLEEKTCGDNSFTLLATASSGLAVTYTSSDPAVASVTDNSVSILKDGISTITAMQSGNSNYNPATIINQTLIVNAIDNSVTAGENSLTANATGFNYQWIDCNNGNAPLSGETDRTFNPETSGNYAVIVSNNGCSVTSDCYEIVVTGIDDSNFGGDFKVYPNPTSGNLTINLAENYAKVEVIIADINGKVYVRKFYYDTDKIDIALEGPDGLYFVTILNKGRKTILKVIKV